MRKWHALLEMMQFPLKVLFFAFILKGIGSTLLNPALAIYIPIANQNLIVVSELLRYSGAFIISNFPLLFLIKLLSRRYDSSVPIFAGIMGYIVIIATSTFFAPQTLGQEFYASILGISINLSELSILGSGNAYPLQMGVISVALVIFLTRKIYRFSRNRSTQGSLSFIDRDTYTIIMTMIVCYFAGFALTVIWPYIIRGIQYVMQTMADDITNPATLFSYGLFTRIMNMLGLSSITQKVFWFGAYGGSWMDQFGVNYLGDVGIWTVQTKLGIASLGAGRLISPYYILNFFAVPALVIASWTLFTNKIEKRKYLSFMVLAIVVSVMFGSLLPFELYLLVAAPFLLVVHLMITGLLFGVMSSMGIFIGYTYSGNIFYASPGNLPDFITIITQTKNTALLQKFMMLGLLTFVLYFMATQIYYRWLALDILKISHNDIVESFIKAVGGIENIKSIDASVNKLQVSINDNSLMNLSLLYDTGVSKIVENRDGYHIHFGSDSYMIRREVLKLKKQVITNG